MEERIDRGEMRGPGSRSDAAAEQGGDDSGPESAEGGVLTLVCFKCGKEYYFASDEPPERMSCEKCRNTVFRSFHSEDEDDEAAADFRDSTERDLHPDDAEGDTMPGDVLDLN